MASVLDDTINSPQHYKNNVKSNAYFVEYSNGCVLIRNGLNIDEQCELYETLLISTKYPLDNKRYKNSKAMTCEIVSKWDMFNPLHYKRDYGMRILDKYVNKSLQYLYTFKTKTIYDINDYNKLQIRASKYTYPKGKLIPHCDGFPGFIILIALGCDVNFMIKSHLFNNKNQEINFVFKSGDIVIFDSSTKANIIHEVKGVVPNTCPNEILNKYSEFKQTRISIQWRFTRKHKHTQ
eukprot:373975_1